MAEKISFIETVNDIRENLQEIKRAGELFVGDEIVEKLVSLSDLDIAPIVTDLAKSNYLGLRKLDIDLALNSVNKLEVPTYEQVDIFLKDGRKIEILFDNGSGGVLELSSYVDIKAYIEADTQYIGNVIDTELVIVEANGGNPTLMRIRDADTKTSNVERISFHVHLGEVFEPIVSYFWANTTSSLEMIASRIEDIINLGRDIDSLVLLSKSTEEFAALQSEITKLLEIHTNLSSITGVGENIDSVVSVDLSKDNINALALKITELSAIYDNMGAIINASDSVQAIQDAAQTTTDKAEEARLSAVDAATGATIATQKAQIAIEKSDEIKNITADAQTISSELSATASYDTLTGKLTFGIPQGKKGLKGDKGDSFKIDVSKVIAQKYLYDDELAGFSFLATDEDMIYFKLSDLSGDWSTGSPFGKGEKGTSINSVTFTSTTDPSDLPSQAGATDTYTITFSDATTTTFTVHNGKGTDGISIDNIMFTSTTDPSDLPSQAGATDTYTITFSDATTTTFTVHNGKGTDGISIDNIMFTSTTDPSDLPSQAGATDTYTIAFSDATTTTFNVHNGVDSDVTSVVLSNALALKENKIHSLAEKVTIVDADELSLSDSEDTNITKKITFANLKAFIGGGGSGGGVDYTATTNPLVTTNPQNDGAIWNNYSSGEIFVCTDKTIGANKWIGTNGTTVPAPATANLFGRIWNIADDVYKRVGLDFAKFSNATQAEFDTWLSPTAERVNDEDTFTPSDLTTELDTNPNLPFGFIKRKVVTNLGVVTDFDHATLPSATEQIMTIVPKTYFADFVVVSGGKWYDVKLTSMEPFAIDVKKDLGFSVVDEIKVWNPTAGISSGTVLGDVVTSALNPAFVHNDDREIDETFIGSFWSISGRSTFGAKATANITLPTARTQHTAFGDDFNQHHYFNNAIVQLLAYIERGSNYFEQSGTKWDGYSWHTGATSYPHNNGLTLSLQNKTGVIKDASNRVIANSYRGIENYHSGLWVWVDGININSGVVHLAKVGSVFMSDTADAPYFDSGLITPLAATGYIEKWHAGTFVPAVLGGNTTTKTTDHFWYAAGWRALLFGGALSYPGQSGLSCWLGSHPASHSDWHIVSRACFSKFKNQP